MQCGLLRSGEKERIDEREEVSANDSIPASCRCSAQESTYLNDDLRSVELPSLSLNCERGWGG